MDHDPIPSLLEAIERGFVPRRGGPLPNLRRRAQVLSLAASGLTQARIGGRLGLGLSHVSQVLADGCADVLRGGGVSPEADRACAKKWRAWCDSGDTDACARLRH
jgi:hypothetical protein